MNAFDIVAAPSCDREVYARPRNDADPTTCGPSVAKFQPPPPQPSPSNPW